MRATAAKGNNGMFLWSARTGAPHPTGYELQIFDDHEKFPTTGSLVGQTTAKRGKIRAGAWQTFEVA